MNEAQMKIAVILSVYDKMTAGINKAVNNANTKLSAFVKKADNIADKSFKSGSQLIASGMAVGAPIYKAIDAATEFETKMIDIRKQMGEGDTPEGVKQMSAEIFKLGKTLPLATSEIQDMVASGLRMGIAQEKIIDYTKEVSKMAIAFDMPAGEVADSMGKISNVFKIPIEKIGDFADAINYLDDNTMAKGPELIDVLQRIGGSARALEANDAAALASTMLSIGESAETAGSGINAMINRLSTATMQSKKFQGGMDMLHLDAATLQKKMSNKETAQGAILEVFDRISNLPVEQQTEALSRLFGTEHGPKLIKLANNMELYRKQLNLVKGEQQGSMDAEYQKRIQSTAAQMQIFKNRINELWVKIGTALLPTLNRAILMVGRWIDKISIFIDKHPDLIAFMGKAVAAFSGLALAGGYLSLVVGGVARFFSITAGGAGRLTKAIAWLTDKKKGLGHWIFVARYRMLQLSQFITGKALPAIMRFGNFISSTIMNVLTKLGGALLRIGRVIFIVGRALLTNPIFLAVAIIAGLAYLIYKNWDAIKTYFFKVWDKVKVAFFKFIQWAKNIFLNFTPHGLIIKHWDKIIAYFSGLWGKIKGIFMGHVKWVMSLGKLFLQAGKNIINSIVNGILSMAMRPVEAIRKIVKKVRDFLPFSPAKEGPLKDIHKIKLIETIAHTIRPAALVNAMKRVAGSAQNVLSGISAPVQAGGSRNGTSPNITFNITLNGGASKADASLIVSEAKKQFEKWMKQHAEQKARVAY